MGPDESLTRKRLKIPRAAAIAGLAFPAYRIRKLNRPPNESCDENNITGKFDNAVFAAHARAA